jgi:putative adenylate-forming enzyme
VALVLRAGSPLYERASTLNLGFRYFDQARPWDDIVRELVRFRPTMLVAPARVLAMLAAHAPRLRPERVVSVAEVLDELDRKRIEAAFGCRVEQIYQATEGLLGITCEQGTLHLMEPWVLVEPLWLDEARTRCTPLVTDLWRRTQPVIRYRLNDVWRVSCAPCGCGRAALALDGVDGRMDDLLWLDGQRGEVCVFPDLLTRGIVMATESLVDYEVVEMARGQWRVALDPLPDDAACRRIIERLQALAASLGAYAPGISVVAMNGVTGIGKQRRVRGLRSAPCAY